MPRPTRRVNHDGAVATCRDATPECVQVATAAQTRARRRRPERLDLRERLQTFVGADAASPNAPRSWSCARSESALPPSRASNSARSPSPSARASAPFTISSASAEKGSARSFASHAVHRIVGGKRECDRLVALRARAQPHRRFRDHRERPPRAREQPREIEARDVLHHAPARAHDVAGAGDGLDAQHVVARRSERVRERTGGAGRDRRAERARGRAERIEREPLSFGAVTRAISASEAPARAVSVRSPGHVLDDRVVAGERRAAPRRARGDRRRASCLPR